MRNRRDFIKSVVGASAGVVFTGCSICEAMAGGTARASRQRRKAQACDGGESPRKNG